MKNKGFTLVELLAVIVILAIISLIAVPIVLNLINDSRQKSLERSIDLYASAVNTAITSYQVNNGGDYPQSFEDLKDTIDYKGEVSCTMSVLYEDGTFYLANCYVNNELVENYTYGVPQGETAVIVAYANAVEKAINSYQRSHGFYTISFKKLNIDYDGNVECNKKDLYKNGQFYLAECTVNNGKQKYTYGIKQVITACRYEDSEDDTGEAIGKIDLSDVVICGTESFYVMSNDGKNVTLFAEKNITLDLNNPIQSDSAGTIAFSTRNYWYDYNNGVYIIDSKFANEGRTYPYVYGDYPDENAVQQNLIYPYVEAYEKYLKTMLKVNSASATLMSYEQAEDLGCNGTTYICNDAPSWLFPKGYWLGSVRSENEMWRIHSRVGFMYDYYGYTNRFGVRPVITISLDEIN